MTSFDIIPDIHGQFDKLLGLLDQLGWHKAGGSWRSPEPDRQLVFLGDFIDRGPNNGKVLEVVRELVDAGLARAIMGNHELNAIHFHNAHPDTGDAVRPHSVRNKKQHATFLEEFPVGSERASDVIDWFLTLPLWLDLGPCRVVHACWSGDAVETLQEIATDGVLPAEQLIAAGRTTDPLYEHVDVLTKGPEIPLPRGHVFRDIDGHERSQARLAWWRTNAKTWQKATISVPDPQELPDEYFTADVGSMLYPEDAKPVFFGHYWMFGRVKLEAQNALCLDYSAGSDGPLISYRFSTDAPKLALGNILDAEGIAFVDNASGQ